MKIKKLLLGTMLLCSMAVLFANFAFGTTTTCSNDSRNRISIEKHNLNAGLDSGSKNIENPTRSSFSFWTSILMVASGLWALFVLANDSLIRNVQIKNRFNKLKVSVYLGEIMKKANLFLTFIFGGLLVLLPIKTFAGAVRAVDSGNGQIASAGVTSNETKIENPIRSEFSFLTSISLVSAGIWAMFTLAASWFRIIFN